MDVVVKSRSILNIMAWNYWRERQHFFFTSNVSILYILFIRPLTTAPSTVSPIRWSCLNSYQNRRPTFIAVYTDSIVNECSSNISSHMNAQLDDHLESLDFFLIFLLFHNRKHIIRFFIYFLFPVRTPAIFYPPTIYQGLIF